MLVPIRTESHVSGSRILVTRDNGRFFEGDVAYVLDSQAEGFYRVWHYGDVFVIDASGIRMRRGWDRCETVAAGCWAQGGAPPGEIWWSKVQRPDGRTGWIRQPIESIDGVLVSD